MAQWKIVEDDKWPYPIAIKEGDTTVAAFDRCVSSTRHKSLSDLYASEYVSQVQAQMMTLLKIVRAVNSHDDLLSSAETWIDFAEATLSEFDAGGDGCDPEDDLCCHRCKECGCIQLKIRDLRAAIAKAKGTNGGK